eukprot:5423860-Amphidinium_carterae.1
MPIGTCVVPMTTAGPPMPLAERSSCSSTAGNVLPDLCNALAKMGKERSPITASSAPVSSKPN